MAAHAMTLRLTTRALYITGARVSSGVAVPDSHLPQAVHPWSYGKELWDSDLRGIRSAATNEHGRARYHPSWWYRASGCGWRSANTGPPRLPGASTARTAPGKHSAGRKACTDHRRTPLLREVVTERIMRSLDMPGPVRARSRFAPPADPFASFPDGLVQRRVRSGPTQYRLEI